MPIFLHPRSDRMGGHIFQYLVLLVSAHSQNQPISYDLNGLTFSNTPFVQSILSYINNYNWTQFGITPKKSAEIYKQFADAKPITGKLPVVNYHFGAIIQLEQLRSKLYLYRTQIVHYYTYDLQLISQQAIHGMQQNKSDIASYIRNTDIYSSLLQNLATSIPSTYTLPFDPHHTIVVHLRLDDVKDRNDYDGSICHNYYKNVLEEGREIHGIQILGYCNMQTPLDRSKVEKCIAEARAIYPEHEVVIVTSPGDYLTGFEEQYRVLRNEDACYDLFLLCNTDVLVMSRSMFAFNALLFGSVKEVWCPLWGHFTCTGLGTKYDEMEKVGVKMHYFF